MLKPAYLPLRASAWADPSSRCECFSLCHPGDAERFYERLDVVRSTDSPWYQYLRLVYGGAPRLPFELHRQEFWYTSLLPTAFELCPHNVSRCPRELCAGWLSPTALRCEGTTCGKQKPKTSFLYPWLNHSLWSAGHTFRSKVSSEYVRRRPFSLWMMRQAEDRVAPDPGAWMEVLRVGTERWHAHRALKNHEGRNGYGCWFWAARGSGVWINVGANRLAFNDRPAAQQAGMPPGDADRLYARAILARNATTMQITHSNTAIFGGRQTRPPWELILAAPGCMEGNVIPDACPPDTVELRGGLTASRPCTCQGSGSLGSDKSDIINCVEMRQRLRSDATPAPEVPPLSTATTTSTCGDVAVHVVADLPAPLANRSCAHGASTSSCMREACCTPGGNKWNNLDVCTAGANSCLGRPFDLGSADAAVASLTYETNEFLLGALFKERLAACSVAPERAELVLVPYLVGELKALRSLGAATVESGYDARVRAQLAQTAAWRRCGGCDHVLVLSHDVVFLRKRSFATGFGFRPVDNFWKNVTMLSICGDPHVPQSFGVPFPSYVHSSGPDDMAAWSRFVLGRQRSRRLTLLTGRHGVIFSSEHSRSRIMQACQKDESCHFRSCDGKGDPCEPRKVAELYLDSVFCLQPPGDSVCRRGVWDSLFSGCIPVTFPSKAAGIQSGFSLTKIYPWYLSPGTLALVEAADYHDAAERVRSMPDAEVRERQQAVAAMLPRLAYATSFAAGDDAVATALRAVRERVRASTLPPSLLERGGDAHAAGHGNEARNVLLVGALGRTSNISLVSANINMLAAQDWRCVVVAFEHHALQDTLPPCHFVSPPDAGHWYWGSLIAHAYRSTDLLSAADRVMLLMDDVRLEGVNMSRLLSWLRPGVGVVTPRVGGATYYQMSHRMQGRYANATAVRMDAIETYATLFTGSAFRCWVSMIDALEPHFPRGSIVGWGMDRCYCAMCEPQHGMSVIVPGELVRHTGRRLLRAANSTSFGIAQVDLLKRTAHGQTGRHCGQFKYLPGAPV